MRFTSTALSSLHAALFASAIAVAGCGARDQGPTDKTAEATPATAAHVEEAATTAPTPVATPATPLATPDAAAAADTNATTAGGRTGHRGPFELVEALDLRPEQRAQVQTIRETLDARLEASRGAGRELAGVLAAGIETGKVDDAAVRSRRAAVQISLADARKALGDAANAVHATLDPQQRSELVLTLRARHQEHESRKAVAEARAPEGTSTDGTSTEGAPGPDAPREHRGHGMGRLVSDLGLSADQKKALHDGVRAVFDAAFPEQKQQRERMAAERVAAEEAFLTDSFDAHRYTFGTDASRWIQTAAIGASALSDLAATVLTPEQRVALAHKIREGSTPR